MPNVKIYRGSMTKLVAVVRLNWWCDREVLHPTVLMYRPSQRQALALSEGFRQRMLENNIQMYNSMLRPFVLLRSW